MLEFSANRLEEENGFEEVSNGDGDEEDERDPPKHVVDHLRQVQESLSVCGC